MTSINQKFYFVIPLLLLDFFISGSSPSYSNGRSRFQEFRGCNESVLPLSAISQEDEGSTDTKGTTTTITTGDVQSQGHPTTEYPLNNYYTPLVLGPHYFGFGNNRLTNSGSAFSTANRFGGGNDVKDEGISTVNAVAADRFHKFRESVLAYRNQITGNRFFDMDGSVGFVLYTRKNPSTGKKIQLDNKNSLEDGDFKGDRPTKIIIHGFSDIGALGEWVSTMRDAYLSTSDVNVIVADFSTIQTFLLFWTNLPVFASKRIADLVTFLELTTGTSRENFHIIARAWGTHVAGVTGRLLKGKVGRITGLEPEPRVYGSVLPDYRLVAADAQFVDIVRVNGRRYFFYGARFGLAPPAGHVDIYPHYSERSNGCPGTNSNYGRNNFAYCQRGRGVTYFIESIRSSQSHPMCQCRSYTEYKSGSCTCSSYNSNFYLGEQISNQTRGVFQLTKPRTQQDWLRHLALFG